VTGEGVVLGTAAYMSPEQARGQALDARSDLWAFGCVLFEMLSGSRAFPGATISDVIAAILTREPDWTLLPKGLPSAVTRVVRRCLTRDTRERLRHAADARLDLQEAVEARESSGAARRSSLPLAIAAALGVAGGVAWIGFSLGKAPKEDAVRASIVLPSGQALETDTLSFALSQDGKVLVYAARRDGVVRLYARRLDTFRADELPGTDGARSPVVSPDGAQVAFFADGKLKRVPITGGPATDICDTLTRGRGAAWGDDGTIVFSAQDGKLVRVDARGGTPDELESPPEEGTRLLLEWPEFLPGSRFLVAAVRPVGGDGDIRIGVYSFQDRTWRFVGPGEQPRFILPGWLLFHAPHVREGDLQVMPFDLSRGAATGEPRPVMEGLYRGPAAGGLFFSVSQTGHLVYARGGLNHALVKVDHSGKRTRLSEETRGFRFPAVSPDGRRVAVTIDPRPSQIWVYDIERGARIRISGDRHSIGSVWSPDGLRLAYSGQGAVVARADGSGAPEKLSPLEYPSSWAKDGTLIITDATERGPDIYARAADGRERPLVVSPVWENEGTISPDGRWFAYASEESGRREVYVRPYPDVSAGKWVVSTGGGRSPVWSPDSGRLFYMAESTVMAVRIRRLAGGLAIDPPQRLFDGPFDTTQDRNFDVFPDGSGFVMVEVDPDARPTRLSLVTNWAAEMSRNAAGSTSRR
jgi:Tol biopolymer transport system component